MEALALARVLWRRRWFLVVGLAVTVAMALGMGAGAKETSSAVAWTRVALDTPESQLVDSAPRGADTLPWRASLVSHLMETDATQRELASRLGLRPDLVTVVDTALAEPKVPASMPASAAKAAAVSGAPYVLTVFLPNPYLPVIAVIAAAPTPVGAQRLAAAGVAVLGTHSSDEHPYSSKILTGGGVALKTQPFVVQQVTPIHVKRVTAMAVPVKAIGVPVFLYGLWCVCVVLLPRLLRRRLPRRRVARAAG